METLQASPCFEFSVDLKPAWRRSPEPPPPEKEPPAMPPLRKALVVAYQIQALIDSGKATGVRATAALLGVTPARVSQLLSLRYLAPKIQEEIMLGDDAVITVLSERNIRVITKTTPWDKQILLWQKMR